MKLSHLLPIAALALGAAVAAQAQPIKLRVAGNFVAAGLLQQQKEQPFFADLAKHTACPSRWNTGRWTCWG